MGYIAFDAKSKSRYILWYPTSHVKIGVIFLLIGYFKLWFFLLPSQILIGSLLPSQEYCKTDWLRF